MPQVVALQVWSREGVCVMCCGIGGSDAAVLGAGGKWRDKGGPESTVFLPKWQAGRHSPRACSPFLLFESGQVEHVMVLGT